MLLNTQFKVPLTHLKDIWKVFISSLAMLIPLILLNDLNILIIILISSLVYGVTFLSLKGLDEKDIKIIKNIIPQKINRK